MIRKKEPVPSMEDILLLSKGGQTYEWVCAKLLKCVVGCATWNMRYYKERLSDVATDSDESFLVLTIENNYHRWMDEARHWATSTVAFDDADDSWKENISEALYTNSGTSKNTGKGSSRRFQGWSRDGYLRFNALHKLVREDRQLRSLFEIQLLNSFKEDHAGNQAASESEEDEEEIFPANDMGGVSGIDVTAV
jgi:hypothetical protein